MINKSSLGRGVVYLLVIIVSVLVARQLLPKQALQPQGMVLPLSKIRLHLAPTPRDEIALYKNIPASAQRLARINIEYHQPVPSAQGQDKVLTYAKQLAAKAGARGLAVIEFGYTGLQEGNAELTENYIFHGIAFR